MAARTIGTLQWLTDQLDLARDGADPLPLLLAGIPGLGPSTAAMLRRWLVEADQRIRTALGLGLDRYRIAGVPCPGCQLRRLELQTSCPDRAQWTVVCAATCVCRGVDCSCRMPVLVAGVKHIWLPDTMTNHAGNAAERHDVRSAQVAATRAASNPKG